MKKRWSRAAMRFTAARFLPRERMLDVTFENGDRFLVPTESLIPQRNGAQRNRSTARGRTGKRMAGALDWNRLRIGETGDVLEVVTDAEVVEIPWDRIRSIADPAYRRHLSEFAVSRARNIGSRIRALRLEMGMNRNTLARRIGLSRTEVAELETGEMDLQSELMERIAEALGRPLGDLAIQ